MNDLVLAPAPTKVRRGGTGEGGERRAVEFPAHGAVAVGDEIEGAVDCEGDVAAQAATGKQGALVTHWG